MCWSIKNIFNKNKIGKNDNTDIGNNKNNKIKGNENNVINSLSVGKDNISNLLEQKINIDNHIFKMKEKLWYCTECKNSYDSMMFYINKIIKNDELKNSDEWKLCQDLCYKINNWEKVITCNNHMIIGKKIKMKMDQIKDLNYSINELLIKK